MLTSGSKPPVPAWVGDYRAHWTEGQWVIMFSNIEKARRALADIQTTLVESSDVMVALERVPDKGDLWYIGEVD